jgi:hypothetical protein
MGCGWGGAAPPGVVIVNVSPNSDFLNLRYFPAPFGALGGGPKYEGAGERRR